MKTLKKVAILGLGAIRTYNIPVPVNQTLVRIIKAVESQF